jgi:alkylation response protein AidB-like acyl-CoA dehydrogenase
VGNVNEGWKVAMGTLGFERGTAFLAQQLRFEQECLDVIGYAKKHDLSRDPNVRQKLADAWIGVQIMKYNGFRTISKLLATGSPPPEASISKLYWSHWHRHLGELEMELMGPWSEVLAGRPYELEEFEESFLVSRAETIYTGSTEIQKNIIGERALGLPREPAAS